MSGNWTDPVTRTRVKDCPFGCFSCCPHSLEHPWWSAHPRSRVSLHAGWTALLDQSWAVHSVWDTATAYDLENLLLSTQGSSARLYGRFLRPVEWQENEGAALVSADATLNFDHFLVLVEPRQWNPVLLHFQAVQWLKYFCSIIAINTLFLVSVWVSPAFLAAQSIIVWNTAYKVWLLNWS